MIEICNYLNDYRNFLSTCGRCFSVLLQNTTEYPRAASSTLSLYLDRAVQHLTGIDSGSHVTKQTAIHHRKKSSRVMNCFDHFSFIVVIWFANNAGLFSSLVNLAS